MLEAFLAIVHPRWRRFVEVPVVGSVRGVIDCVLGHPAQPLMLAIEVQSPLRRAEAMLRRSSDKAEGLRRSESARALARRMERPGSRCRVSSCFVDDRQPGGRPGSREDVHRGLSGPHAGHALTALRDPAAAWPGPAIVWVRLHGRRATVMEWPPRRIILSR